MAFCELTAEHPRSLGELQTISLIEHATEPIKVTTNGVDVPSYLVGYTGFLVIETNEQSHELRIPEPGLEAFDDRLVPYCANSSSICIRPRAGPHRQYEILDTRETTDPPLENPPLGDYEGLDDLLDTVAALTETVSDDDELEEPTQSTAVRTLHELQSRLCNARQVLFNPTKDTDVDWHPTADYPADLMDPHSEAKAQSEPAYEATGKSQSKYLPSLEYLTTELERFDTMAQREEGSLARRQVFLTFRHANSTVDDLYELLCSTERTVPSREETDGRGETDGRWLEHQLRNALQRWGYSAEMQTDVYSLEVDVLASRRDKQDDPTDWILAQCKDWKHKVITPHYIYRLCMLAFTCKAMPVLCHTTSLTERARQIAERWEVRVLELEDLHRGSLPAPKTLRVSDDLCVYPTAYSAREKRGRLPGVIFGDKDKHFTYVPGYEPVGPTHEYQPIEREDEAEDG